MELCFNFNSRIIKNDRNGFPQSHSLIGDPRSQKAMLHVSRSGRFSSHLKMFTQNMAKSMGLWFNLHFKTPLVVGVWLDGFQVTQVVSWILPSPARTESKAGTELPGA